MDVRRSLILVSVLETLSFVVLLGAMVAGSEQAVSIVGAIHGVLFLAYAWLVVVGRGQLGWRWSRVALLILTGPIGAVIALELLRRQRHPAAN